MRKYERMRKCLSILLCLLMLVQYVPTMAFAAETDGLCEHHTEHTVDCGYTPAAAEIVCTHEHTEVCNEQVTNCRHTAHNENCGGVEAATCTHACSVDSGCMTTVLNCGHVENGSCCYVASIAETPCSYVVNGCTDCTASQTESTEGTTEPFTEATEPATVCTCGTDDALIHATTCAVYVAPENPVCYCTEKCTEVNEWCDVCGFDISKCGGEDTAAAYDGITSGTCGDSLTWEITLNEDSTTHTLTINGSGAMADYEVDSMGFSNSPWSTYSTSITDISLPEGLTSIGTYAFYRCNSLRELVIPGSVETIGNSAIAPETNITVHYLGAEGSVALGTSAVCDISLFHYCKEIEAIEATCVAVGHEAGWYCTSCQKYITGAETTIDSDNHNMVNGGCADCDYECTHEEHADGTCTLCGVSGYKVSASGNNIRFDIPDFVEKGKNCVAEIAEEYGYMLTSNLQVLVGGTQIDDFYMASGKLTIPAEQITGDIEIIASADKNEDASNEHIYLGLPVFTWGEDHSCTATLTCARIGCTHSETDTCTVTNEVTATSDCVTAAQTVYTATVTLNDKEFSDSKAVTGEKEPANHAKNTNTKYTPNEDGTTHSLICDQCKTAIQTGNHTFDETSTCTLCGAVCSHSSVHQDGCSACGKPAVVFVANEEGADSYYCDLATALSYGDAVASLLVNFTLTEDLTIPANMILDTNGHTLTVPEGMTLTNNGGLAFGDIAHYSGEKGTYQKSDTATVKIGTSDGILFENKLYYLSALCADGYIGIDLDDATSNTYYPAGAGYAIFEGDSTLRLHNAVITTPDSDSTDNTECIHLSTGDLTIYFSGNNRLISGNTNDTTNGIYVAGALTLIAEGENAALTVQCGNSGGGPDGINAKSLTVNGGTVTAIGGSTDGATSSGILVETNLTVNSGTVYAHGGNSSVMSLGVFAGFGTGSITVADGAALYATGGEGTVASAGVMAATVSHNVNALGIAMSETEDAATIDYTVYGDLVLDKNVTISNPYAEVEDEEENAGTVTFTAPAAASLTVNEGVTLDLSGLEAEKIEFLGNIINNGTIRLPPGFDIEKAPQSGAISIGDKSYAWNGEKWICGEGSHVEKTPATCTTQAVCETCGEEYGDFAPDNHVQGCTLSYEVTEEGKHTGTYSLCKATFTKAHDFENAEHKCVCGVIETFQVFLFPDSLGMTTGTATFGVDFVQPITVPENTHLEIKGVYLDDDPSVPVSYTYENGILTIPAQGRPDGDITVDFFHYVEVTFHANGGVIKPEEGHPQDGWGYPEDGSYWIQKHGVSGYIHLANYAGMSRTGYTFKNEWQDENGTCYSHGDIASGAEVYSVYTDLTLYAQWQCLHTGEKNRTYENMGTYHNYVETCAICGENTDRGVMVEHDYDETTHSCVCGAIETFTITFDPANGEEKIPITRDYGTAITAPKLTYDGYHFVKWDTEVPETMPALDEELTITAVWEAHSGGEATCETQAVCEICGTSYGNLADHSTSYTAEGMTITYKCATCDTQTVTFTLVIPNGAVYGSSGLEVPHYDCSDKAYNGELPMITLDGKELKDFVPNAGTYAVTMTWGGQTVSGEYTIAPKELTAEDVTITLSPDSFLYDGSEKLPTVTIKLGDETLDGGTYAAGYDDTNTTCDYQVVIPNDRVTPGQKAITIFFRNNYSGEAVVHYTITIPEAILSPATPNGENGWYKDASLLAPSHYAISTIKDGKFGSSLDLSDSIYESINYWLTYTDNVNCEPISLTWMGSIKVDGTGPTVSGTADSVTDSTASITVTAEDNLSGVASVTLTCADSSVSIGALTDGVFPVSGMQPNTAYTFTLTAKDEAGNESDTTVNLTTERGNSSVIEAPTAKTLTYTGQPQELVTAGSVLGGTLQYSVNGGEWSEEVPTASEAGYYQISYQVVGNSNYEGIGATALPMVRINKAKLTITAEDHAITYGDETSANGITGNGFVSNEDFDDLSGELTYTFNYERFGDVGTYKITPSGLTSDNYEITFVDGDLTVTAKEITVTAEDKTKTYGESDPALTYKVEGLVNGDELTGEINRAAGENVGSYDIEQNTLTAGDNYTINFTGAELSINKRDVSITAKDQNITYGETISGTEITATGLVDGHSATATLTPSTANVTVNGTIIASAAVITVDGTDVTNNYVVTYGDPAELVIEPDTSRIDALTTDNVTSANEEDIKAVQEMLENADSLTEEWEAIGENCEELLDRIEETEAEKKELTDQAATFDEDTVKSTDKENLEQLAKDIEDLLDTDNLTEDERAALETVLEQVEGMIDTIEDTAEDSKAATDTIDALDPATVTSDDKDDLEQAIETIDELLKDDHLNEEERSALEDAKADAEALIEKIEAAQNATDTENTEKVEDVTAENVKPEDKEALEDAKADLEKALEDNAGNYTEEEKKAIQDEIQRIEDAIEALENVEDVTDAITQLPETVEPDDEEAAEKILDAKEAYDELTDHEKSLVDETTKKKLDDLVASLTAYDIIKGDGGKWTKGSDGSLTFTANGPFSKFVGIEVDGKEVDEKYYDAKAGSTIITLKQSFLKRLSTGEHTITVLYTDGETSGTFKILAASSTPATGDTFNILLHSTILMVSLSGMIILILASRKRRKTN